MKRILLWAGGSLAVIAALFFLFVGGAEQKQPDNLPWKISAGAEATEVFHVRVGQITLREMIEQFRHFPEIALFTGDNKAPRLEAYFGKQRLGVFEARLIAEMEASEQQLQQFVDTSTDREAQASGAWKYTLSEAAVSQINEQKVHYLIYMPVADYEADIVAQRFGAPEEKFAVSETAEYWFYPQKGLVILLNSEGSDVLYYSALSSFAALRERLITESAVGAGK